MIDKKDKYVAVINACTEEESIYSTGVSGSDVVKLKVAIKHVDSHFFSYSFMFLYLVQKDIKYLF